MVDADTKQHADQVEGRLARQSSLPE